MISLGGMLKNWTQLIMKKQPILEIYYFDAGGGHRSAMNALRDVLAESHPEWVVRPVNLQKLLEPIDPVYRITQRILQGRASKKSFKPIQLQDVYNSALKRGATYGMGALLPVMHVLIKSYSRQLKKILQQNWQNVENEKPDIVLSVIPNFNGVLFSALKGVLPDVPYITIMTDMVDYPPHFWMEDQDQIMICGTEKAYAQAKATGFYKPENIVKVSGMILKKSFYNQPEEASLSHRDIGLFPDYPTALIMFGGNGSLVSQDIIEQLEAARLDVQTIVMCGDNKALYEGLQGRQGCHAVGFVADVTPYMRLADFLMGKPGPGSISEAIHMGCPVIVECNASTMPQERPNVEWILEHGVGIAVKNFKKGIAPVVERMIRDLAMYKSNIKSNIPANRAVFEIAAFLPRCLRRKRRP